MTILNKVIIYITRPSAAGDELLVFDHRGMPEAGTQVPAGSVEDGESSEAAAVRELHEESGLSDIALVGPIDAYDWTNPTTGNVHRRKVFRAHVIGLPDAWEHTVHGEGDDAGMIFDYRWVPLAGASDLLQADQGQSISKIGRAAPLNTTRT